MVLKKRPKGIPWHNETHWEMQLVPLHWKKDSHIPNDHFQDWYVNTLDYPHTGATGTKFSQLHYV